MEDTLKVPGFPRRYVVAAVIAACGVLAGGGLVARALLRRGGDLEAVITGDARPGRRVVVGVSAVANNAGVGGEGLSTAAREAIESALGERSEVTEASAAAAQRGARGVAQGHTLLANIQSVESANERTVARVSIVVSSRRTGAYEFESSASVTLTGPSATTPENQADAVRRAMHRATLQAVDQMMQTTQ